MYWTHREENKESWYHLIPLDSWVPQNQEEGHRRKNEKAFGWGEGGRWGGRTLLSIVHRGWLSVDMCNLTCWPRTRGRATGRNIFGVKIIQFTHNRGRGRTRIQMTARGTDDDVDDGRWGVGRRGAEVRTMPTEPRSIHESELVMNKKHYRASSGHLVPFFRQFFPLFYPKKRQKMPEKTPGGFLTISSTFVLSWTIKKTRGVIFEAFGQITIEMRMVLQNNFC